MITVSIIDLNTILHIHESLDMFDTTRIACPTLRVFVRLRRRGEN